MGGDFFAFSVEGYAEEQAFVDVVFATENFVQGFESFFGIFDFGVETNISQVNPKNVEVFSFGEIADKFEDSAVSTECDYEVGFAENMAGRMFVFCTVIFAEMLIPHDIHFLFLEIIHEFLKERRLILKTRAAD